MVGGPRVAVEIIRTLRKTGVKLDQLRQHAIPRASYISDLYMTLYYKYIHFTKQHINIDYIIRFLVIYFLRFVDIISVDLILYNNINSYDELTGALGEK